MVIELIDYIKGFLSTVLYKITYRNKLTFLNLPRFGIGTKIYIKGIKSKIILGMGFKSRNYLNLRVINSKLVIGDNVFFNNNCSITCLESITIGNNCLFGEGVKIYDHNHLFEAGVTLNKNDFTYAPIAIGEECWIGSNAVILKGVTIGDNCVIGAGVIVYKDIPSGSILVSENAKNLTLKS